MSCIKTGCLVYLDQYGEWVYGDAFEFANQVLVIRAVAVARTLEEMVNDGYGSKRHFTINEIAEWFDRPSNRSPRKQADVSTIVSVGGWINHGYQGILDPMLKGTPQPEEEPWVTIRPDSNRDVL